MNWDRRYAIKKKNSVYNPIDFNRLSDDEHNETLFQSNDVDKGNLKTTPAIARALKGFASNKGSFTTALKNSTIQPITKEMNLQNSDIGTDGSTVNLSKMKRVQGLSSIDRPIVLHDQLTNTYHCLSGNTRATTYGYGIEAHVIKV